MNTIVIDCGASYIKGACFRENKIISRCELPSPPINNKENIFIPVQIVEIIKRVKKIIVNLINNEKEVNLCISNEMHGFILCNENGEIYTDYISWQKEYGKIAINGIAAIEQLSDVSLKDEILYTGMPLRSGLPSCNLLYLKNLGYLKEGKYCFYTLGDYIIRSLSGKESECHITNAAATGLFDFRTNNWNDFLINYVCGDSVKFPNIGSNLLKFKLFNCVINVKPAIGDQQAALLGAGLNDENDISFNLGTGAQVTKLVYTFERDYECQIRPYFNNLYLKTIPHIPAGRAINVYIRFLKKTLEEFDLNCTDEEIWNVVLKSLSNYEESQMRCDMSFFENTISKNTKGAILNIGEYDLTLSNLMYAIFVELSQDYMLAAKKVDKDLKKFKRILFSGGIARKIDFIRKRILENFNKEVEVIVAKDETLFGLYKYSLM